MENNPDKIPLGHTLKRSCKCKWESVLASIQSGLKIKPVLQQVLKFSTLKLSDSEWNKMEEVANILEPVKVVVEVICREDADLLNAEVSFKELFGTLGSLESESAQNLLEALKVKISNRWHSDVAGLLKYLNNPVKNKPKPPERAKKSRSNEHVEE